MERRLFTIGTGQRTPAEFIGLLKRFDIKQVIDVRRFPKSRFCHFEKENLALMLRKAGIEYFWMGDELGGYRQGGYEVYTKSPGFKQGLEKLVKRASEKRTAILCAEKLPSRCHRRFISRELERLGWQIEHII